MCHASCIGKVVLLSAARSTCIRLHLSGRWGAEAIRSMSVILLSRITRICSWASYLVRQGQKSVMFCAIFVAERIWSGAVKVLRKSLFSHILHNAHVGKLRYIIFHAHLLHMGNGADNSHPTSLWHDPCREQELTSRCQKKDWVLLSNRSCMCCCAVFSFLW